ncbi:MAG: hypothetical protein JWM40_2159 [Frankiales bacterium]|nr:hypothetical protein [Frankiales bacterium]
MPQLATQPYTPADGTEYVTYVGHLTKECGRLQQEGRIPGDQAINEFLDLLTSIAGQVRADVRSAGGSSVPLTTTVAMSADEYKKNWALIDSVNSLLLILEMRGAIDLMRTEGATRVMGAVLHGTHS